MDGTDDPTVTTAISGITLPVLIAGAGERAARRFLESSP
jgi:hypothetical protein